MWYKDKSLNSFVCKFRMKSQAKRFQQNVVKVLFSDCREASKFSLFGIFFERSKGREAGYRDLPLIVDSSCKLMSFLTLVAAKPLWYQCLCVY